MTSLRSKILLAIVVGFCSLALPLRPSAAAPDWLLRLNQYRAMEGLRQVTEDAVLSQGDAAHAQYVVKNYAGVIGGKQALSVDLHVEQRGQPGFTYSGFVAGRASDVVVSQRSHSPVWAVDGWMAAPFHRFPLLNPDLYRVGYGDFCDSQVCAAAMNLGSDSMSPTLMLRRRIASGIPITGESEALGGGWGTSYSAAIKFPPDGATVELMSLYDNEWPNPLSNCPGYALPTGVPITLQLGRWLTPKIRSWSLTSDSKSLEVCAFDSSNYANPDELTQKLGRGNLEAFGAVMLVPRAPLKPGTSYTVSMVVQDVNYKWSFSIAAAAPYLGPKP